MGLSLLTARDLDRFDVWGDAEKIMSQNTTQEKAVEYDFNSDVFTEQQIAEFYTPFTLNGIKAKTGTTKTGKSYTRYEITIIPDSNPSLKIKALVFRNALDQMRAIKTLNPRAHFQATARYISETKRTVVTYSGVNPIA